ncbi:hypothetical protein H072_6552 [Dactylellina haptotyla CBS 200.50]|uniref:Peptidase A1 domain-containing protein n=1 Tax=Dactylellina haptotyla (strain CBS 200.50) TaxID=1284197 RepID=S8A9T3_DACHA|nr:hypothetical protein H072_6552 [Dactylellina haptotyla CBS 200.50]
MILSFLLIYLPQALSRPQGFSDEAFEISTNSAADISHILASPIPTIDQDGEWSSVTAAHPTGLPTAQSVSTDVASYSTSNLGGIGEAVAQDTSQPASPTHLDDHAIIEVLQSAATETPSVDSGSISQDINSITSATDNEFILASQQSAEPGFVPVYFAGGYFVAELTIGSEDLVFLKVDTSSFHFWVISSLLPELCRPALRTGAGCYTPGPDAEVVPNNARYTFTYPDGLMVTGTKVYSDAVSAADIFGAAKWEKQILALPEIVEPWDDESGIGGVLPLGFNAKQYWASRSSSSSTGAGNTTENVLAESPLDITNWHFFTTYFKPGRQMFIGFDYEPKELYAGSLMEVPVAGINGSWFVQPDGNWATVSVGGAAGTSNTTTAETITGSSTETAAGSESMMSGTGSDMSWSTTANGTSVEEVTATDSGSGSETTADAAASTGADITEPTATDTVETTDATSVELTVDTATASLETGITSIAANAQLAMQTSSGDIVKRDTTPQAGSEELPILLDTGSKETYISSTAVKSIYGALSGSCLTVNGGLYNCTYPCSFNYSSFAIKPKYDTTIGLPWGTTTIALDMTQFASEVYDECHPVTGEDTCSMTCRGLIQATKPGREYHVYGSVVFKSAFFKWDTSGNGTVGMAPYADRGGGSWYYA